MSAWDREPGRRAARAGAPGEGGSARDGHGADGAPGELGRDRAGEAGLDRRSFLGTLPGLAAAWAAGVHPTPIAAASGRGYDARHAAVLPPGPVATHAGGRSATLGPSAAHAAGPLGTRAHAIGVQLYTLRTLMADDLEGTLAAVADIGYEEVELAGLWRRSPAEFRALLDGVGLRAASSHHGLPDLRERWPETLAGANALGQAWVVCPSIGDDERTAEGLRRVADDFNRAGEAAREAGLRFGYHNHDWEFRPLADGTVPYDLLLERCDPALVSMQLDLFWIVHGGRDPHAYFAAHPGRFTSVHVKDRTSAGEMVAVGRGVIDFASIVAAAGRAGIEHWFVEHDRPADPIEDVRTSFGTLRALLP